MKPGINPAGLSAIFVFAGFAAPGFATTKGLNQIVTPDIQPPGQLSLSFQQQDPVIGNRAEVQVELGLTKRFEAAIFQGASPSEQIGNVELGLVQKAPFLLSTGFLNWSSKGSRPQPFLEGGYVRGNLSVMAGVIRVVTESPGVGGAIRSFHETQGIVGGAYHASPRLQLQMDYQAGSGNFATAGFTYNITPTLQLNPAVYRSNASPHRSYGYAVLTWNLKAW